MTGNKSQFFVKYLGMQPFFVRCELNHFTTLLSTEGDGFFDHPRSNPLTLEGFINVNVFQIESARAFEGEGWHHGYMTNPNDFSPVFYNQKGLIFILCDFLKGMERYPQKFVTGNLREQTVSYYDYANLPQRCHPIPDLATLF